MNDAKQSSATIDSPTHCPYCGQRKDAMVSNSKLRDINKDLLEALRDLRKEIRAVVQFNVKKHYSLMVADACATKAILKAEGK